jgi:hypothetical protein
MDESEVEQARPLRDALAEFSETLAVLQKSVRKLAERVGVGDLPALSGDELEAAWIELRSRYERTCAEFWDLADTAEDAADLLDALAAREESRRDGSMPISHEELKAKLGFE